MITLALLKQMEADQVADLVIDRNLFWEEMPLQKDGIYLSAPHSFRMGHFLMQKPQKS